jgi:phosphorylcholine metabolism protein LicD
MNKLVKTAIILLVITLILLVIFKLFLSFFERYPRYPLKVVQYILKDYIRDFDLICRKNQITYWADSGTLLGAIRDKGIIDHDDDIDVCMYEEDFNKLIKILKNDKNYYIYSYSFFPIYKFGRKGIPNIFIDIFIVENVGKNIEYKEKKCKKQWPKNSYKKDEVFPLKTIDFEKGLLNIPKNPEPYLERMYGNWKVPVIYNRHIL